MAFHVSGPDPGPGGALPITEWFGERVEPDTHLDPDGVAADLGSAGFAVEAHAERRPRPGVKYSSRRCTLLARRR